MCSTSEKASVFGFSVSKHLFVSACAATNIKNLELKTISVEGAYLSLAAITFQVGVNNSLNAFAVTDIREKICQVSVPVESAINWWMLIQLF